jgi:hypothetical protein
MTLKQLIFGGLLLAKSLLPFTADATTFNVEYGPYTSIDPAIVESSGNHDNGALGIQCNIGSKDTKIGLATGLRFEENLPGNSNVMGGFGLRLERQLSPSWSAGLGLERYFSSLGNYHNEDGKYDPSTKGTGNMDLINLFVRKTLFSNKNRSFSAELAALYKDGDFRFTPGNSNLEYDNFDFKGPAVELRLTYLIN